VLILTDFLSWPMALT